MKFKVSLLVALLSCLPMMGLKASEGAPSDSNVIERWWQEPLHFSALAYGWLPHAPAIIDVNSTQVAELPEPLDTILNSLNMAAMMYFELQRGRLRFYLSPVYYDGKYNDNFIGSVSGERRKFTVAETASLVDYGVGSISAHGIWALARLRQP